MTRSQSTAWRWLKVPRRTSCPTSRMRRPSQQRVPKASASAMPQSSGRAPRAISARASSSLATLGWTAKPCGTSESAAPIRASRSAATAVTGCSGGMGPPW